MKPLSVSFSATSSVYPRIGYETVLNKCYHSCTCCTCCTAYTIHQTYACGLYCAVPCCISAVLAVHTSSTSTIFAVLAVYTSSTSMFLLYLLYIHHGTSPSPRSSLSVCCTCCTTVPLLYCCTSCHCMAMNAWTRIPQGGD